MGRIILDADFKEKLRGMNELLEVCDEDGNPLGYFLPVKQFHQNVTPRPDMPFTEEDLDRFRKAGGGGPLSEFWQRMGQS